MLLDHVPSDERGSVVTAMKKALDHWLVYRDAVAAACGIHKRNEAQKYLPRTQQRTERP